ncbi:MAG: glycosyltransferase [Armatimonas sp.]
MKGGPLEAEVCELGIPTINLGGMSKLARLATAMKLFLTQRPDIIHAQNKTALQYSVFGKKFCQAPIVITNHGQGLGLNKMPSIPEWKKADAIVMVSNAVMNPEIKEALGERIHTIYNGVAFSQPKRNRQELRAELGILQDRIVGIIVARVDDLKGHENLVNAIKNLKDEGVPLTVLLAGDGAKRADREQQAAALGLGPDEIRFLGFRSDIEELLAASDFFVLPLL